MSEITDFMNGVKEYAVAHNIDFILKTNEGEVSNGLVIRPILKRRKDPEVHIPNYNDLARIYKHFYDHELTVGLIKGNALDTFREPSVYLVAKPKENKYSITVIYEDVSYNLFDVMWYITGWNPTLTNYLLGIMTFTIMNNQLIELMMENSNLTKDIVDKEYSFKFSDSIDTMSLLKELPWDMDHAGLLKTKWEKLIDGVIDAIKFSINEFYRIGTL